MKFSDLVTGAALSVLGFGVLAYGFVLPPMPGQRYGAGLFPILLGFCFMVFGAILARHGLGERRTLDAPLLELADWAHDVRLVSNMGLVLLLILVYVTFSERIGFVPLSLTILIILFWRFGVPLLKGVTIAALTTMFIQVGFSHLLRVPLPRGVLHRILW